jgi:hypothetical protein
MAARKAGVSDMAWSDGITSSSASGVVEATLSAATQAAGAVLRPIGSSRMHCGATPAWRSCSPAMKRVLIIGDQDGGGEALFVGDPQRRLLQQRALGDQRQKLFRVHGARHGPKPRAGAAGQDDGMDWGCTSRHLEIPSRGR